MYSKFLQVNKHETPIIANIVIISHQSFFGSHVVNLPFQSNVHNFRYTVGHYRFE